MSHPIYQHNQNDKNTFISQTFKKRLHNFLMILTVLLITLFLINCSTPVNHVFENAWQYRLQGNSSAALNHLNQALISAERQGNNALKIQIFNALTDLYLAMHQWQQAHSMAEKAVQLADTHQNATLLATSYNSLANVFARQQQFENAFKNYQHALTLLSTTAADELKIKILLNLLRLSTVDKSQYFQQAHSLIDKQPSSVEKGFHLISLGQYSQQILQQFDLFNAALKIGQHLKNNRLQSFAYGHLAELYYQQTQLTQSLQLTRQAIFFAQTSQAWDSLYRWQWHLAKIFQAQTHIPQAIKQYQIALQTLNKIRPALILGYLGEQHTFEQTIQPIYFELVDLLLQQARQTKKSEKKQKLLKQAQQTVEQFKTIELENYFQDDCVSQIQAKVQSLETNLPTNTAIIYPIILPNRVELLVNFDNQLVQITETQRNQTDLAWLVQRFTQRLEQRYGQRIYQWLFSSLDTLLKQQQIHTLVIVPHGVLLTLPFAALHDGKQYLLEKYALVITPSLDLTDPRPLPRRQITALLGGLSQSTQTYPPLPHVPKELAAIHQLLTGPPPLQNQNFVVDNLKNALQRQPYTIIHLATHGEFNANAQQSFLLTYEDKLTMDRLTQLIRLSQFREQAIELLTLSACQTAKSDDEQAALGLAGVAIKAGARSALASLWAVDDAATAQLLPAFYQNLQNPQLSKAQALQKAQLQLLHSQLYQHPRYWAAFLLIGNWL